MNAFINIIASNINSTDGISLPIAEFFATIEAYSLIDYTHEPLARY